MLEPLPDVYLQGSVLAPIVIGQQKYLSEAGNRRDASESLWLVASLREILMQSPVSVVIRFQCHSKRQSLLNTEHPLQTVRVWEVQVDSRGYRQIGRNNASGLELRKITDVPVRVVRVLQPRRLRLTLVH